MVEKLLNRYWKKKFLANSFKSNRKIIGEFGHTLDIVGKTSMSRKVIF
jgi:hypothetical protein